MDTPLEYLIKNPNIALLDQMRYRYFPSPQGRGVGVRGVLQSDENCYNSHDLVNLTVKLFKEFSNKPPQNIIISETEPIRFIATFIAAYQAGNQVFLCNPNWGLSEWEQVQNLVKCKSPIVNSIMIPTGGSSGKIRFAIHTWSTIIASVRGFQEYFGLDKVNSICLLPLYHVSGFMQLIRSLTSNGKLLIVPFQEFKLGQWLSFDNSDFFISLVPTQLQFFLSNIDLTNWLSQCQTVLLGGAPAWSELLTTARSHKIRLAPTYGMTETASQIATLKPEMFLAGKQNSGQILPHHQVSIIDEDGKILGCNQTGKIAIKSSSLALGYYPELFGESEYFYPDDLGYFDSDLNLHIVGRSSDKIITGGENVFPAEVEAVIKATNLVEDVAVIGKSDRYWGEIVVAIYIPKNNIIYTQIQEAIQGKLTKFKIPKQWLPVESLPRNEQGKINRKYLKEIISLFLG